MARLRSNEVRAPFPGRSGAPRRDEWHRSLLSLPLAVPQRKFTIGSGFTLGRSRDFSKSRGQLRCWNLPLFFFHPLSPPSSFLSYSLSIWGDTAAVEAESMVQARKLNHGFITIIFAAPLPPPESPCELAAIVQVNNFVGSSVSNPERLDWPRHTRPRQLPPKKQWREERCFLSSQLFHAAVWRRNGGSFGARGCAAWRFQSHLCHIFTASKAWSQNFACGTWRHLAHAEPHLHSAD